jgi:hypothetical protein
MDDGADLVTRARQADDRDQASRAVFVEVSPTAVLTILYVPHQWLHAGTCDLG